MASQFMPPIPQLIEEFAATVLSVVKRLLEAKEVGVLVIIWQFGVFGSPQARAFCDWLISQSQAGATVTFFMPLAFDDSIWL